MGVESDRLKARHAHLARELQVALQAERVKARAAIAELDEQRVAQARAGAVLPHTLGAREVELFEQLSPAHEVHHDRVVAVEGPAPH